MRDRLLLPCPEAMDRFALHLDGELGDADGRRLEDHLDSCASCRLGVREMSEIHRDLALRSALEEISAGDPVPAVLARARWEKAAAMRPRRVARTEGRGPSWLPVAVAAGIAACLLVALLAIDRPTSPRRTAKSADTPRVEAPRIEGTPAPAPRVVARPKVEAPAIDLPAPLVSPPRPDTPAPAPDPAPSPPALLPSPTVIAPAAIAKLERVDGTASLEAGRGISTGETLGTLGPASRAVVAYPDGTRLYVGGDTSLTFGGRGKAIVLARGEVAADVAPQPREEPMTFTTSLAEVKVLGTWLTVACRPDSTLVEVDKGRVQVTRLRDQWSIPLREGHYAAVDARTLPVAKPMPGNLLADPGFEADGMGWGGVLNPQTGLNFGGVSVTPDALRSGKRALQFITSRTFGCDRETFQDFAAAPGEAFEVAGWARTAGIGGKGVSLSLLWLGAGDFSGELVAGLRPRALVIREDVAGTLTGTNDWARLAARAVAPPQARQVRVMLFADVDPGGPTTAWFDDLVLRRTPKGR